MIENELLSNDDGVSKIIDTDASLLAKEYYTSYSKYVLEYRALPSIYDGLKPVQRRIIYTANQFPQKLMKTSKMAGSVLQYHPHGSISIEGSINDMAHPSNIFPMFTTKGNFGGIGFGAAAGRYTECYLSEVARQNFCQFIDYADYEVGEIGELEPDALPCLIPYSNIRGSEGIGVGFSTKIMPLNLLDTIDYYIDYIKKGKSKKLVKPDVGYTMLEMDDPEIQNAVSNCRGQLNVVSVISQLSNNSLLLEDIYDRSIDAVLNKIDKKYDWLKNEQVGFRDMSSTSCKYIFEIYDTKAVSITELETALKDATRRSGTYSRVVEEDGCAVYSSFEYTVKKSLECLNKAIDKKISHELAQSEAKLLIYNILEDCKKKKVFDNITKMTTDQLIDLIVRTTNCSQETASEIVKKPISYLTKSHDVEARALEAQIEEYKNHDRTAYLVKLYKDFRRAVQPFFEEKKHTITKNSILSNPCIKIEKNGDLLVTDGSGTPFDKEAYFVSESGYIHKVALNSTIASYILLDTEEKIVGFGTDKYPYIDIKTDFVGYDDWYGRAIIDIKNIQSSKQFINLRTDEQETITSVDVLSHLSAKDNKFLKGTRVSQTVWAKKKK